MLQASHPFNKGRIRNVPFQETPRTPRYRGAMLSRTGRSGRVHTVHDVFHPAAARNESRADQTLDPFHHLDAEVDPYHAQRGEVRQAVGCRGAQEPDAAAVVGKSAITTSSIMRLTLAFACV